MAPIYGLLDLEPIESGREVEDAHEGRGGLLVAWGHDPPLLQSGPEPLDYVPVVVDPLRTGNRCLVALGGNGGSSTALPDVLPEGVAGVASVPHHPLRHARQAVEERDRMRQFMRLTRSHDEGHRSPEPVGDHTSLGAIAPARSPKRLTCVSLSLGAPFCRAPAAFWCARMLVPSRNVSPSCTPFS